MHIIITNIQHGHIVKILTTYFQYNKIRFQDPLIIQELGLVTSLKAGNQLVKTKFQVGVLNSKPRYT